MMNQCKTHLSRELGDVVFGHALDDFQNNDMCNYEQVGNIPEFGERCASSITPTVSVI